MNTRVILSFIPAMICFLTLGNEQSNGQEMQRKLTAVPFTNVQLTDTFWAPRIQVNRDVSVPHNIDWCENQTARIRNFQIAAGEQTGKFKGIYFDDSDVYKILEGFAYTLQTGTNPELKKTCEKWIHLFAKAQREDGYLMCYFQLEKPGEKWTNLASMHELYCAGHLTEAAVAYTRATGDKSFLDVCTKLMNLIIKRYGYGKDQLRNVPGHEEIELALVKLYELTGDKKYLDQAKFFIDVRGVAEGREKGLYGPSCQDHKPVRDMSEIVGHAVRAMYLNAGATDVAGYFHDESLLNAMNRLWDDMTLKKMYITGGIGSLHQGEAFGDDFFLPNDSAYCETCAAIGVILWAHRMYLATGELKFAEVLNRAMYNGMLSGYGMNGDSYFYVNPLASNGNHHRQPFFDCACCPSNVIRTVASLPGYVYATTQSDEAKKKKLQGNDTIIVNMLVDSTAKIELADGTVELVQKTQYPLDGKVEFQTHGKANSKSTLNSYRVILRYFESGKEKELIQTCAWGEEKTFAVTLNMPVIRMVAHPNVKADNGRVALQRGPLVYCFEQCDNEVPVDQIVLPKDPQFKVEIKENFISSDRDNAASKQSPMRTVAVITCKDINGKKLTAIPYYAWDNRAPGKMAIWVRQVGLATDAGISWTSPSGKPILYQPLDEKQLTNDTSIVKEIRQFQGSFQQDVHSHFNGDDLKVQPKNSGDTNIPRATFWDHRGTKEWFEFRYLVPRQLSESSVYWFDDTGKGQCRVPKSWRLVYQESANGPWREVQTKDHYATDRDRDISVRFESVTAIAIRMEIELQPNFSGGILKWNLK